MRRDFETAPSCATIVVFRKEDGVGRAFRAVSSCPTVSNCFRCASLYTHNQLIYLFATLSTPAAVRRPFKLGADPTDRRPVTASVFVQASQLLHKTSPPIKESGLEAEDFSGDTSLRYTNIVVFLSGQEKVETKLNSRSPHLPRSLISQSKLKCEQLTPARSVTRLPFFVPEHHDSSFTRQPFRRYLTARRLSRGYFLTLIVEK